MLTRKSIYAVRALAILAEARGTMTAAEVADRAKIPERFLSLIFALLGRDGIVRSHRGRVGGYELAVDPRELSLGRITASVDGGFFPFACAEPGGQRCPVCPEHCATRRALARAGYAAQSVLTQTMLVDMMTGDEASPHESGARFAVR